MEIKIGTHLILEPTSSEKVEKFHCKVVEQKDHILYITYPVNNITKKTVYLIDGTQLRAIFQNEEKISFAFNTEVIGRINDRIPMIMLSLPSEEEEFIKIQRREFVRVNTPVDVAVEYLNHYYQFVTEDISAGGLALRLNTFPPFAEGDNVKLTIVLPYKNGEIKYVQTDAEVIRIFEKKNQLFASLQFTDTDDLDKQYIVRFCFERQLMLRKETIDLQ
ncbi:MAG: glycosyltransferase [Lysinibacillus sp.]|nr:glycosyltransferase [Lysinibacillus sp.]